MGTAHSKHLQIVLRQMQVQDVSGYVPETILSEGERSTCSQCDCCTILDPGIYTDFLLMELQLLLKDQLQSASSLIARRDPQKGIGSWLSLECSLAYPSIRT